jgi:hypothetical protein
MDLPNFYPHDRFAFLLKDDNIKKLSITSISDLKTRELAR